MMAGAHAEIGSKRGNGYDDYADMRPNKQSRDGKMTARFLLLGRFCGAIVGKGGETVKKTREKHRVQINGLNRHTDHRVLSISGARENVIDALKEIIPTAAAEAPIAATQRGGCAYTVNLLVPGAHIGAVIGKGGAKIKEIMEVCGGKANVHPEPLPNSTERLVAIGSNTMDQLISALGVAFDTLEAHPKRDNEKMYEPNDDPNMNGGGGSGDSGMGDNHRQQQQQQQNNQNTPQQNNMNNIMGNANNQMGLGLGGNQLVNNSQLGFGLGGGANAQQQAALSSMGVNMQNAQNILGQLGLGNSQAALQAMGLGRQGLNMGGGAAGGVQGGGAFNAQNQMQGMNRGPQGPQLGNQMNNQMMNNPNNQQGMNQQGNFNDFGSQLDFLGVQTKTELTVTPEMCGAIIGKGGRSIKELKATTGVRITVAGNDKGSKEDRTVTLSGTQQQIQNAEQMITEFVRSYRK